MMGSRSQQFKKRSQACGTEVSVRGQEELAERQEVHCARFGAARCLHAFRGLHCRDGESETGRTNLRANGTAHAEHYSVFFTLEC